MPSPLRVLFDTSIFANQSVTSALWVSDGTGAGTSVLKTNVTGGGFTQFGTNVLFAGADLVNGTELWVTDGSAAGTSMLKNIKPGPGSGFRGITSSTSPTSLRPAGDKMVFLADDGSTVSELWVTDGTTPGTSLLINFDPGNTGPGPNNFTAFGNRQLFQAFDGLPATGTPGGHGAELWVTDGTLAGTTLVKDLNPAANNSGSPENITDLQNGRAVFSAAVGSAGRELWVTDGSAAGTSLLKDINPVLYMGSNPSSATLVGSTGLGVFAAIGPSSHQSPRGGNVGTELWVTDGLAADTSLLKTFSNGYQGGFAFVSATANGTMQSLGNKVLFTGADTGANALWVTDGTPAGTQQIAAGVNVDLGTAVTSPTGFTPVGTGKEVFWNTGNFENTPWVTDGTAAGTFRLSTTATSGQTYGFVRLGNRAVFQATTTAAGAELWITDGTIAGTYMVRDINTQSHYNSSRPHGFATFGTSGNKVMFTANDGIHGDEPWVTDGTSFGTSLVKDINTNNQQSFDPKGGSGAVNFAGVAFACFAAGTRIRTARGQTPVEALRPGDQVTLAGGGTRPVRWIGYRTVDLAAHPRPHDVAPVCIAPHAFGENRPHAALRVSPDHAIYADGVLVPARYLVNGATITREHPARVTWYHVELAGADGTAVHDILLAESLPTESYLDTGNRSAFANGGAAVDLHPDFASATSAAEATWATKACARLVTDGPELLALRSWLLHCAVRCGHAITVDPAFAVECDGRQIPVTQDEPWLHLDLPTGAKSVALHSRSAIPAEIREDGTDTRRLGIAITAMQLDHVAAPLNDARLRDGWHAAESALRWTSGSAVLDVRGLSRISLAVIPAAAYWADNTAALPATSVRLRAGSAPSGRARA